MAQVEVSLEQCLTVNLSCADFLKLNVTGSASTDAAADAAAAERNVTLSSIEVISRALLETGPVRQEALRVVAVGAANNVPFQQTWLQHQPDVVPWLLMVCNPRLEVAARSQFAGPVSCMRSSSKQSKAYRLVPVAADVQQPCERLVWTGL